MKKHVNIPVFIPHLGCPNQCVFCNQRFISGVETFSADKVVQTIDLALLTISRDTETEIAFFGGSFTGIDRALMISLLETAQRYVERGQVQAIRLSTRPDYIDVEVLEILSRYSVRTIELGIQSMDDAVLRASRRGHTAEDSARAAALVRAYGFSLVGQMMVGLPASTPESEQRTAAFICDAGAAAARIYPVVVFHGTELCGMMQSGLYEPLESDEAADRAADILRIFARRGVSVIRVGLCAGESLASEDKVLGGAFHPALGEMTMGRLYGRMIAEQLRAYGGECAGKTVEVSVAPGEISKAVGYCGENRERLKKDFHIKRLKIVEKNGLMLYNILSRVY